MVDQETFERGIARAAGEDTGPDLLTVVDPTRLSGSIRGIRYSAGTERPITSWEGETR